MVRSKRNRRSSRTEEDPMAGTTNLVDAMLVISVGLLVFLVMSWNMQSVVFNADMTPEEKESTMEKIKSVSEVKQGKEIDDDINSSNSSGEGYVEMGKVYKDPNTGKLIMVE
ncbi:MAG: DUF2149 domain-containing protein [Methanobrevibacter arboriphilus]|jgi:hypothetical protein|uniref:Membrane protein n=2 Tax=Methanobrevibacter arboriphilus TaxID=39441 RepID=A0ACA8R0P7_METAZ|nr:DUF2149 domain-containing protein [Methanobrevibacter arboriphilus]MBF4468976.1 DUF2149 domain-containing protein [Methanobrevibacter arboriphilus]MCC7562642.1 DUF2149 domain-containing protein [Methanobrevibacter arboriphilus]BBL61056.1 membrane protein [Methanobrevibacter arboriphilus]GLI12618.1 membrane protein [Methanobrevibacter arboriphilus]